MTQEMAAAEAIRREEAAIRLGGGAKAIERQHEKGRLAARERIAALLDPGTELAELGLWAAWGMYQDWGGAPSAGVVTGVVDYTIKEVTDALLGGIFDAGPERLRTAGRRGYPQVVVPGAVEVINFGPVDTVPAELRDGSRPLVRHNEQVTAVRATSAELELVADDVASRLNGAVGPTVVMVPRRGFDSYASGEGPFAAPADDDVFITRLRGRLRADLELEEFDMDINDPRFADAVADRYLAIAGKATPVDQRSALP